MGLRERLIKEFRLIDGTRKKVAIVWGIAYEGRTEEDRRTLRATVCDLSYKLEKVPTNAVEFLDWFYGLMESIPEDHRGNAVLKLHNDNCDECSSERADFVLTVDRQETDDEYKTRMEKLGRRRSKDAARTIAEREENARRKEEQDRAEYERLKAKYS